MSCIKSNHEDICKPEVYCALSLSFGDNVNVSEVRKNICAIGVEIKNLIHPKYESGAILEIAVVEYEQFWDIDQALSKMFSMLDVDLLAIRMLVESYHGTICIDIAIIEHGTYPAMLFGGENMKKIHDLRAQISIDLQ